MSNIAPEIAIEVHQLAKTYKTYRKEAGIKGAIKSFFSREIIPVNAVRPSSFSIKKGEFVGLLGPNGAGKTTMLKMMTGLIPPTSGGCTAFGQFDTAKRPKDYLRRIGMVMGQRNQLHPDLPAIDSFKLSQAIYAIDNEKFQKRLDQCLDLFEIREKLNIPVRKLSLGERMKMELILAILHEPELLFLDEPTIGLDFNAAKQIRSFLAEANRKFKITVILTSHYTKDIEELCRRVILINHGALVYDGSLEGLDDRVQGERLCHVTLSTPEVASNLRKKVGAESLFSPIGSTGELNVSFAVPTKQVATATQKIMEWANPHEILDLSIEERGLEDIFAEIYQRPLEEKTL
jgi:ABC-2 type transport system ATP-binding protein